MKKWIATAMALVTTVGCLAASTGCTVEENIVNDEKTINVRLYKAGFGDTFIYELKQKFESVYADEGYKMNVLTPTYGSAGTAMVQEMARGYDNTKIDLYITGAIMPSQVAANNEYSDTELCEDLEELVFNKTAVGYDGVETTEKISQRLMSDLVPFLRADDGTMYGFTWAQTTAGMVANTKKLAAYGVTELPRTTNEMFEIFEKIRYGVDGVIEGSDKTKTYPLTYNLSVGSGGASGYQDCAWLTWFAQYDIDAYNEFLRMQTYENGVWTDMAEGYKVFENGDLQESLEAAYRLMDMKYAAMGSATQTLDQAQGLIMKDAGQNNAIFMLNGDWFLNEVKANYSKNLGNIEFMNVPVISALGVKLFGSNTKYGLSDAECDEVLSYVCKLVDEGKPLADIIASVKTELGMDLDEADVQAVATARGVTFARGIEHLAFITKGCTKKHIAAEVLRMMASDDFAETFLKHANASSPYAKSVETVSQYKFVNQAKAIALNPHFRAINSRVEGLRFKVMKSNFMLPGKDNLALEMHITQYREGFGYAEAAAALCGNSATQAQVDWNDYMSK
jgi:ABC-type glycerol-3-phosphate transport system substrate-binding protein